MRHSVEFLFAGETLVGTIDGGVCATHGLLILSGGNEIRSGGHRGMARLAQAVAGDDCAVFRFDRRGIGDSSGENAGFMGSNDDLAAAIAVFRVQCPSITHITGLGLCDAAAALLLHASAVELDQRILINPWTLETAAQAKDSHDVAPATLSAAAIRARYRAKLKNPREIWRLFSGGVNLGKLVRGVRHAHAAHAPTGTNRLPAQLRANLCSLIGPTHILIAKSDSTAMAFMAQWHARDWADVRANTAITLVERATASHSFAGIDDAAWLADLVRTIVHGKISN